MNRSYLYTLILFLISALPALVASDAEDVSVTFSAMWVNEPTGKLYYESAPGIFERMPISYKVRSKAWKYVGPNPVSIYTKADEAMTSTSSKDWKQVGSFEIPSGHSSYMLFVYSDGEKSGSPSVSANSVHVLAIPDSTEVIPVGGYLFLNYSGQDVRGSLAKESVELAHGAQFLVHPDLERNEAFGVNLSTQPAAGEEWKKFVNTAWTNRGTQQTLIILTPPEENKWFPSMVVSAQRPRS